MTFVPQCFDIVQIFWGQNYGHYLCDYSLPMLLAPNNLPAWPYRDTTRLVIYCPAQDWNKIQHHSVLQALQDWIEVVWEPMTTPPAQESKYFHMGRFHARAIDIAINRQAGLILLGPDIIYCDHTLSSLVHMMEHKTQMVLISSPVVKLEAFEQALTQSPDPASWSRDKGSALILQASHESSRWADFNAEKFTAYPSSVYYRQGERLMVRQFHLHPLLILNPKPMEFTHFRNNPTIDGDYLCAYQEQLASIQIVTQREIISFSLQADSEERYPGLDLNFIERQNYIYIQAGTLWQPIHYHFFGHEICLGMATPPSAETHGDAALVLELIHLALISNQAYTQLDFAKLTSLLPKALALAPKLQPVLRQLSTDLFMCFLCLCYGLFQSQDTIRFTQAGQAFSVFFQRIAHVQFRQTSFDRQLLNLVLNLQLSDKQAVTTEFTEVDWDMPYTLVFLGAEQLTRHIESVVNFPFESVHVIVCAPLVSLEPLHELASKRALGNQDFTVFILEDMQVPHLCTMIDHAHTVLAVPAPRLFLLCLRAAMQGKFRSPMNLP